MKTLVAATLAATVFGIGVAGAQLNPRDVVLALNFDDGQGEIAKDSSDNVPLIVSASSKAATTWKSIKASIFAQIEISKWGRIQ